MVRRHFGSGRAPPLISPNDCNLGDDMNGGDDDNDGKDLLL